MQNVEQVPWYGSNYRKVTPVPGVPIIPPLPDPGPESPYQAQCGECGILIPKGAWAYSCPKHRCPVQRKATY